MNTFQIGLSSWIIQDGNYSDFSVGQEASFALEFYPHSLTPASAGTPTHRLLAPALYSIHGRVEFVHTEAWVIDFGLRAYQEGRPPNAICPGSWVEGEVYVGIDPFFYFEQLRNLPGIPTLTYEWLVRNIQLETTPWLTMPDKSRSRDPSNVAFKDVRRTNARDDDGGFAHYILECEYLGSS